MFHVPVPPAVLKSIVRGAIRKEKGSKDGDEHGAQPQGESATMFEARMEAYRESLVKAMAKSNGKVEVAQIDMEQELKDKQVSLFDLFPTTQWPAGAEVTNLFARCVILQPWAMQRCMFLR